MSLTPMAEQSPAPNSTHTTNAAPPLSLEKAQRMAEFFVVLADPNRWRILSAIAVDEMRVKDLAKAVEMTESAVSHQLRILRAARLVRYRKQGRNVLYCLKDHHILNLYRDVSEHLDEID